LRFFRGGWFCFGDRVAVYALTFENLEVFKEELVKESVHAGCAVIATRATTAARQAMNAASGRVPVASMETEQPKVERPLGGD
jgi:hypothetical protein